MAENTEILFKEESYRILGACFEVYNEKGCGFPEAVYQECLAIEFERQEIPALSKPLLELEYKGMKLAQTFIPDFICYREIIVELKALPQITEMHKAQVMNYLKATQKRLGIVVNFGQHPRLDYLRVAAHDSWAQTEEADLKG